MNESGYALSRRALLGTAAASALLAPLYPLTAAPAIARPFKLVAQGRPVDILIDETTDPAVAHVAESFGADLERVSGAKPRLMRGTPDHTARPLVIIAVKGQSVLLDRLVAAGEISIDDLDGQWEAFRRIVVRQPFPGVPQALVIVGSDRRGGIRN